MDRYSFRKYRPAFFTGFSSDVDEIKFDKWEACLEKYEKIYPLTEEYTYAYNHHNYDGNIYTLMKISTKTNEWLVVGFTDYPLNEKYKFWEDLVNIEIK